MLSLLFHEPPRNTVISAIPGTNIVFSKKFCGFAEIKKKRKKRAKGKRVRAEGYLPAAEPALASRNPTLMLLTFRLSLKRSAGRQSGPSIKPHEPPRNTA